MLAVYIAPDNPTKLREFCSIPHFLRFLFVMNIHWIILHMFFVYIDVTMYFPVYIDVMNYADF